MGLEIEKKFLVDPLKWEQFNKPEGTAYQQGYLVNEKGKTVRVRIAGDKGFITIKGATEGFTRKEYEYEIPLKDAEELLEGFHLIGTSKTRYRIPIGEKVWEIDVFYGENAGLIVAEIELESEDEPYEQPDFLSEEVTYNPRYYNSNLAVNPYSTWKEGTK